MANNKKSPSKRTMTKDGSEAKSGSRTTAGKPMKTTKAQTRQGASKTERKRSSAVRIADPQNAAAAGLAAGETPVKPNKLKAAATVSPASLLARAEADMTVLLESLNTQMAAAMHVFTELAAAQKGKHEAIIRTKPLDRATSMFQRLVTELVDERIGEILPTTVALRNEMEQRAQAAGGNADDAGAAEFFTRGTEMLDQVLGNLDVHAFQPGIGEAFDPLIHLAVGETSRDDLANDVVSEVIRQGFRSVRGKVICAARIKVNRR